MKTSILSFFLTAAICAAFSSCGSNPPAREKADFPETIAGQAVNAAEGADLPVSNESPATADPVRDCPPGSLAAYLDDPDLSGTNIRKSPGGAVVMQLVKDEVNIEYFLTLTEAKNGWFRIESPVGGMENDFEIPGGEGWIHGSVIAADTRNYGGQKLELRSEPGGGKLVGIIDEDVGGLRLKDLCGDWALVEYAGTTGWIETEWLCGNPLTNCS
jgi:hypothetical protein